MKERELSFSQVVRLYLKNDEIKQFKSELKAIEYIQLHYKGMFSDEFIWKMIKKKKLNVEDWIKYPEDIRLKSTKHHYRHKNFDLMTDINVHRIRFLQKQVGLTSNKEYLNIGFCLLSSLYNASPSLFGFRIDEFNRIMDKIKDIGKEKGKDSCLNISNASYIINTINTSKKGKYIIPTEDLSEIEKSIDNDIPIPLGLFIKGEIGHCITIFGYDNEYYYYYENGNGKEFEHTLADLEVIKEIKNGSLEIDDEYYKTEDKKERREIRSDYWRDDSNIKQQKNFFGVKKSELNNLPEYAHACAFKLSNIKPEKLTFSELQIRIDEIQKYLRYRNKLAMSEKPTLEEILKYERLD